MTLILSWLTATLGLWFASRVLNSVRLTSFNDAIWAGGLLAILDATLTQLIAWIIVFGTLGIGLLLWFVTYWIASALVILLASKLSSRLEVKGFMPALITAFIVSATGSVLRWLM